jgi:class 3 adenylate cyclase
VDFYDVVDQVEKLLQRRGRLTYRSLQRQFELDDQTLAELKEEILYAHPQVVDDGGKGLIWSDEGETQPKLELPSQPVETSHHPADQNDVHTQTEPLPSTPWTPNAERRQLTVMFCDLVDSTRLAGELDPEDLRDVIRAYQAASAAVTEHFNGYIAQHLGDGLLVYFGYPQAHEDDAQRAVRAGLGILDAMGPLNTRLEQDHDIRLAVRIGIHTGLVVVGEIGGGTRQEQLALGETPNIAARLQGMAQPDKMVLSAATQRLVRGVFELDDLGTPDLKGVAEPIHVYGVRGERAVESRFEAAAAGNMTPFVGRELEVALLVERWDQAKESEGQVVLLCGEPGIGKSRITQFVHERLAGEPHTRLRYQCSPYYTNSAFYPVIAQLERATGFEHDDTPAARPLIAFIDGRVARKRRKCPRQKRAAHVALRLFPPPPRPNFAGYQRGQTRGDHATGANWRDDRANHLRPPPARPNRSPGGCHENQVGLNPSDRC